MLDFAEIQGAHSGENLAQSLLAAIQDVDIAPKFRTMTGDNAINNSLSQKTGVNDIVESARELTSTCTGRLKMDGNEHRPSTTNVEPNPQTCCRFRSDASRCRMVRRIISKFLVIICQYDWRNVHRYCAYICDGRHSQKKSKNEKQEALSRPYRNLISVTQMINCVSEKC